MDPDGIYDWISMGPFDGKLTPPNTEEFIQFGGGKLSTLMGPLMGPPKPPEPKKPQPMPEPVDTIRRYFRKEDL